MISKHIELTGEQKYHLGTAGGLASILSNGQFLQIYLRSDNFKNLPEEDAATILKYLITREIETRNRALILSRLIGKLTTVNREILIKQVREMEGNI